MSAGTGQKKVKIAQEPSGTGRQIDRFIAFSTPQEHGARGITDSPIY
jgi:hypothetical protein